MNFFTFPDYFLQFSDPKSTIKNIVHHAQLGDIIGSNYPLNPCNCTYQGHAYSFTSRYFLQEREAKSKVIIEITK